MKPAAPRLLSIALVLACQPSESESPDTDAPPPASTTAAESDSDGGSMAMTTVDEPIDTTDPGDDTQASGTDTTGPATTTDEPDTETTGAPPTCGNGQVDPGEGCDDGIGGNADDQACLVDCQPASCGDGKLWAGVEECDLGPGENLGGYGGCNPDCTLAPYCGDEVIDHEHGELCDGASVDGILCKACELYEGARLMFVTSKLYTGADIGGIAGADAHCSTLAETAGLVAALEDGQEPPEFPFRAWLSTDASSVDARFTKHGLPYITRAGEIIAADWEELTDPAVLKPQITQTELPTVTVPADRFWTNTHGDGTLASPTLDCADWTSGSDAIQGRFGTTAVNLNQMITPELVEAWTHLPDESGYAPCDQQYRLYCVEQ